MGNKEDIPTIESVDVHRNFSRKKLLLFVTAFISVILLISLLLFMTRGTVKKTEVPGNNIGTPLRSPPKRPKPLKKIPNDFKSGEILKRRPYLEDSESGSDSGSESADSYFDLCPTVEIKENKFNPEIKSPLPTTSTNATPKDKKHHFDPKVLENCRSSLKPMNKLESETAKKPKSAIEAAADEFFEKAKNIAANETETLDSDSDLDSEKWKQM